MAEWLGKGLQNLLQRFDSASHLKKVKARFASLSFLRCELFRIYFYIPPHTPPLTKEGLLFFREGGHVSEPFVFEVR